MVDFLILKSDQKTESAFDILILTVLSSNLRKVKKKHTFSIFLDSSNISERTICISDRKAEIAKNYAVFYTEIVGLIDTWSLHINMSENIPSLFKLNVSWLYSVPQHLTANSTYMTRLRCSSSSLRMFCFFYFLHGGL